MGKRPLSAVLAFCGLACLLIAGPAAGDDPLDDFILVRNDDTLTITGGPDTGGPDNAWDEMRTEDTAHLILYDDPANPLVVGHAERGLVSAWGDSTIDIHGGQYRYMVMGNQFWPAPYDQHGTSAYDNTDIEGTATINIYDGRFDFRAVAEGESTLNIYGGDFAEFYDPAYYHNSSPKTGSDDAGVVNIYGGTFHDAGGKHQTSFGGTATTIEGGVFNNRVNHRNGSLTISGGAFNKKLYFYGTDTGDSAVIEGGSFMGLAKWGAYNDTGSVHIEGGTWNPQSTWFNEMATVPLTYHFYGTEFEVAPEGSDLIEDPIFGVLGRYYYYHVTGILSDGNPFDMTGTFYDMYFETGSWKGEPQFVFHETDVPPDPVPEPGTAALLGLAALGGLLGARRGR